MTEQPDSDQPSSDTSTTAEATETAYVEKSEETQADDSDE